MGFKEKLEGWKEKRKVESEKRKKEKKELEELYEEERRKAMRKEAKKAARKAARKTGYRKGGRGGTLGGIGNRFLNYAEKVSKNIEESPLTGGKGSLFGSIERQTIPRGQRRGTKKPTRKQKYVIRGGKAYPIVGSSPKKKAKPRKRKREKFWFE